MVFNFGSIYTYNRSCGIVVITSASHAEGHEFDPRQDLTFDYIQ